MDKSAHFLDIKINYTHSLDLHHPIPEIRISSQVLGEPPTMGSLATVASDVSLCVSMIFRFR